MTEASIIWCVAQADGQLLSAAEGGAGRAPPVWSRQVEKAREPFRASADKPTEVGENRAQPALHTSALQYTLYFICSVGICVVFDHRHQTEFSSSSLVIVWC